MMTFTPLSDLKDFKKKYGLKRLKRLSTLGPRYHKYPPLKPPPTLEPPPNLEDQMLMEIMRRGNLDKQEAERVMDLAETYPAGSLPELITYDFLNRHGQPFIYQVALFGGRAAAGGVIPDFVVGYDSSRAYAWNIQGEYWHTTAGKAERDAAAALKMRGAQVAGWTISDVIPLWEFDIYEKRPGVFWAALAGMSLRQR